MAEKAEESDNIKRARQKLEKKLSKERELFNPEKLKEVRRQIYRWIERNASDRVSLKEKNIELFDENVHPATTSSKFVKELRDKLLPVAPPEEESSLRGRIVPAEDSD